MVEFFRQFLEDIVKGQSLKQVCFKEPFVSGFSESDNYFPIIFTVFVDRAETGEIIKLGMGYSVDSLSDSSSDAKRLVVAIHPSIIHLDYFGENSEPWALNFNCAEDDVELLKDRIRQLLQLEQGNYLEVEQKIHGNLLLLEILKLMQKPQDSEIFDTGVKIFNQLTALITPQQGVTYKRPELANVLGVNEQRVNEVVKRFRGFSFQTYYSLCRLEVARRILEKSDRKVAEVGEVCGFKNYAYFVQVFRQFYNITPLQFKKLFHSKDKTLEEVESLHFTAGFVNLTLEKRKLQAVPVEDVVHCASMVCNATDKKIKLYVNHADGSRRLMAVFQPHERLQFGFDTGTVLEICSEDETFLGSCATLSVPNLVICTE